MLEILAFFIGFRFFLYLRRKSGDIIQSSNRTWILIGATFGALIGSRLVGGLEDPSQLAKSSNALLHFYQNKTVLGGFLGGLFGVEATKKMIGEKRASGDIFVYPIMLALIIGRIGCFSMGVYEETYGVETTSLFGMDLGDGKLRHPVTLYEIGFLIIFWITLRQLNKRFSLTNGATFKIFMIGYILFRFIIDFIKPHYTFNIGLSTIQLTCLLGLLWYARYILQPRQLLSSR